MPVLTSTTLLLFALSIFAEAGSPDSCTPPNFPLPEFKSASFSVRDFGAIGNGEGDDPQGRDIGNKVIAINPPGESREVHSAPFDWLIRAKRRTRRRCRR